MVRSTLVLFLMSLMVLGGFGQMKPIRPNQVVLRALARGSFNFTNALYSAMSRREGNIIFSPLSIHSILTMTALGADGPTKGQIHHALHLPGGNVAVETGYRELNKRIATMNNENVLLKMANKIYVNKGVHLQEQFLTKTREVFASEAEGVDFSQDASETINEWVEENTNHRIKDIVEKGSLNSQTAMVLVNAIYFKGKWQTEFEPQDTVTRQFYVSKDKSVPVPMMHVASTYRYKEIEDSNTKVLEIPYYGESVKMMILLPNARDGLRDLETDLRKNGLRKYFKNWTEVEVDLWLPRFRLEQSTALENQLKKMGMQLMFGEAADFSRMVAKGMRTKISDVAHKAFIEVNEEGTEAAAATMVGIQTLSLASSYESPILFQADHPFIFLLYHKDSKAIIFMGRYSLPE